MANPFQQQVRQRKLIYISMILVLFTVSYFWRTQFIRPRAAALALREQDVGDVELSGAAVRLSLTGLRGFATTFLWYQAQEMQKKNQWNNLTVMVNSLTTLQPHFITPWLFQGWNLSYNVSVESDKARDKLFYISEGTLLLARGDRQNRNQPDIRWSVGFFNQHKISNSDETNSLRSLFQLACIHPNERDPNRFRVFDKDGNREIRWADFQRYRETNPNDKETLARMDRAVEELKKFCKDHPMLVRRLQNALRKDDVPFKDRRSYEQAFICENVDAFIRFLDDSQRIPCVYEDQPLAPPNGWRSLSEMGRDTSKDRKPLDERYPPMPPPALVNGESRAPQPQRPFTDIPNEYDSNSEYPDSFEANTLARAWFGYAQEPIPEQGELPGETKPITVPSVQRRPRNIATLIFRTHPALAQSFIAQKYYQEGWFDDEPYTVRNWLPDGSEIEVGEKSKWGLVAWVDSARLWRKFMRENKLRFESPLEETNKMTLAERYREKAGLLPGQAPTQKPEDISPEDKPNYDAYNYIREYNAYRQMSNAAFHYHRAVMEEREATNTARKRFFQAEGFRNQFRKEQALRTYRLPDALTAWREKVLMEERNSPNEPGKKIKVLSESGQDEAIQEDTYEIQLKYLDLANDVDGPDVRQQLAWTAAALATGGMQAAPGSPQAGWILGLSAFPAGFEPRKSFAGAGWIAGPFDGTDDMGNQFYSQTAKMAIDNRYGLVKPQPSETGTPPLAPPGEGAPPGLPQQGAPSANPVPKPPGTN